MTDLTSSGVPARPARTARLGWRAERRPAPGFAHVLGAVAGAFTVVATVAFVGAADREDPQVPGIVFSLVLVAVALVVGAVGPGPLRSAATTALVLTVPLLWLSAIAGDGAAGRGAVRGVFLLSVVSYALLYVFGWTKGRNVLLGGALIALTYWAGVEVAGSGNDGVLGATFSDDALNRVQNVGGTENSTSAVVMLLGLAYLVAGGLLDRRRLTGAATPLLVVGAVASVSGGVTLAGSESTLAAGIVAVLIGAAVGIVGAAGHERRGTTWFGALVVFGGLVAILVDVAPSDEAGIGGIAIAIAVVCGGLAWWLARVLGEPDDGDARAERPGDRGAPEAGGPEQRTGVTPGQ